MRGDFSPRTKFHLLDGMRGIAAIGVMLYHLGIWSGWPWIFPHGYLAVDFFFCLSGFVLAHAYGQRLKQGYGFLRYAIARLIRLWPVIVLGAVLGGLYALWSPLAPGRGWGAGEVAQAFVMTLFMVPFATGKSPIDPALFPINTPFWSLFYELVMSLAWGLVLRRVPPVLLLGAFVVITALVFGPLNSFAIGSLSGEHAYGLARVGLGFSAGLLAYRLYAARPFALPGLMALPLVAVFIGSFALPTGYGLWVDFGAALLLFPALVYVGAAIRTGGLGERLVVWLGNVSYPLYGVHRPVLFFWLALCMTFATPWDRLAFVIGGTAVALLVADVSFRFYDRPLRAWLRRRTAPAKAA